MKYHIVRQECANCNGKDLHSVLNLGEVPLAGSFPKTNTSNEQVTYPLQLLYCKTCHLVQTDSVIDPSILFRDYRYMSSVGLTKHFQEYALWLDKYFKIQGTNILEIGSNDGVLLEPLKNLGAICTGIDPATNIVDIARSKGLNVINDFFGSENVTKYKLNNKFDFILSNNAFAHIINIKDIVLGIRKALKENAYFIFEVHYLGNLIREMQWDNIYHEHIYYYSIKALHNLLYPFGILIQDYIEIPIHSGSIRVIAQRTDNSQLNDRIRDKIKLEEEEGLTSIDHYRGFQKNVLSHIGRIKIKLAEYKNKGLRIAGYGASGRANMFVNLTEIDRDTLEFVVDESPERCHRYIANSDIPIVPQKKLLDSNIDVVLILAWNYSAMIMKKLEGKKYMYVVAFPDLQEVRKYKELKGFSSI